jgi:hypothetical protein
MVNFSSVWKDSGFLEASPPFLVIPYDGIGLVYLNGVRSLNIVDDLKFDRTNLSVTEVNANDIARYLMLYSQNFPLKVRTDVSGLAGSIRNVTHFGRAALLAIDGSVAGVTAAVDYVKSASRAKMDVYTAKRKTVAVSFRFIRYQNDAKEMKSGTALEPPYAEELVGVLNRLFIPSANIELILKSAGYANVNRQLGPVILKENFLNYIVPLRDQGADLTVFFVGRYKGTTDPLGEAFANFNCAVVNDSPWQFIAPDTAWPDPGRSDDEINYAGHPLDRPKSDRDLHIVLAHEIAHLLGAGHNDEQDNLMSNHRQDFKLSKDTIRAINNS